MTAEMRAQVREWQAACGGDAPKPKRRERPEDVLHVAVRRYLQAVIAPPGALSRDRVVWFSIESRNSGATKVDNRTGRTFNLEGQRRKSRGCVAGVPDVHFEWPGGSAWIELKAAKGRASDAQDSLHDALRQAGALVEVCRSVEEVEAALERWNVPTRRVQ